MGLPSQKCPVSMASYPQGGYSDLVIYLECLPKTNVVILMLPNLNLQVNMG